MRDDIDNHAESVKPARRDNLARLGDKLDAADKAGGDEWVEFIDEYGERAINAALKARLPKIKMKTPSDRRLARAALAQARACLATLNADLEEGNKRDQSLRDAADIQALIELAERDVRYIERKLSKYADKVQRRHGERLYHQRVARNIGHAIQAEIRKRRVAS